MLYGTTTWRIRIHSATNSATPARDSARITAYRGPVPAVKDWSHKPTTSEHQAYINDLINQYPNLEMHDEHQSQSADCITPGLGVGTEEG